MVSDPLVLSVRSLVYISVDSDPIGYYLMLINLNTSFWSCSVAFLPCFSENGYFIFFFRCSSLGETLKCLLKNFPRSSHKCKFILDSVRPLFSLMLEFQLISFQNHD
jgi:hypothetical protein